MKKENRKLIKARAWAKLYFAEGSEPSYQAIRDWVTCSYIDGELVGPGQQVYIYEDQKPGTRAKAKDIALQLAVNS
ncbi:hypothetical protein W04_3548 [Pseudoalteromonas sp. SW0106-04]|uniref:hypothetical protein n=1 Tax=Pseudoalteromonas sp. SW0106-04 TaxID=1702169 RepID=UPI0006B689AE|nr:hypothetical protein [Pseudoalteromonas sp. SW0106-04]GAP76969.1 hypothetical protein W04_3548 [Pseudoalteromonas sp. SW0106-04]